MASASVIILDRIRKRTPSGASTENPLPRPGTTSTVSEEPEGIGEVGHQQSLGLLIVIEHHPMVLAADSGAWWPPNAAGLVRHEIERLTVVPSDRQSQRLPKATSRVGFPLTSQQTILD